MKDNPKSKQQRTHYSLRWSKEADETFINQWFLEDREAMHYLIVQEKEVPFLAKSWCCVPGTGIICESVPAPGRGAKDSASPVGVSFLSLFPYKRLLHQCSFNLYVLPAFRKKGVGSLLLAASERLALRYGVEKLLLELPGHPQAQWFEQRGFEKYAQQDRFYFLEGGEVLPRWLYKKELVCLS